MDTQMQPPQVPSGADPLKPLTKRKYLRQNPAMPHLLEESEEDNLPYTKHLFRGRVNRRNYLLGMILVLLPPFAGFLILYLDTFLFTGTATSNAPIIQVKQHNGTSLPDPTVFIPQVITPVGMSLAILGTIAALPMLLSLQIRRLHDIGKTGKIAYLLLLPGINILLLLYLLFVGGEMIDNRFGPRPLPRVNIGTDVFKLRE